MMVADFTVETFAVDQGTSEGEVFAGVPCVFLKGDRGVPYPQLFGTFGLVDGFAVGEDLDRRWCVGSGEDHERETALMVEVCGVFSDADVVAGEPDGDVGLLRLVVHLVVIPEDLGGIVHDASRPPQSGMS